MKVLVVGVTGMLGRRLANALAAAGHTVVGAGRSRPRGQFETPGSFIELDFSVPAAEQWWLQRLQGVDAVINTAGIFTEARGQTFDAVHHAGPAALFRACALNGHPYVVQVSALGSDDLARTPFHQSKAAGDAVLRGLGIDSAIVQPSLIHAPEGRSSRLLRRLALLPVVAVPAEAWVQPVDVRDVVEGIVKLVESRPIGSMTVPFVGKSRLTFGDYLATLRKGMKATAPGSQLKLSGRAFTVIARVAGMVPGSMLDKDGAAMLLRGNTGETAPFEALLGRAPKSAADFMGPDEGAALRTEALLDTSLPVLRWSIAAVWIWTALVSFGIYPVQASLQLLSDFGLRGTPAQVALYGAAALDMLLGLMTVLAKGRWWRLALYGQLGLIGAYTAMITWRLPEWWLHPFGALSKNLPMLAAILVLLAVDRRGKQ